MPHRKVRTEFPSVGTVLTRTFKGETFQAKVLSVNPDAGSVTVELKGQSYNTLTAAAKVVTGTEVNGWKFWGLE